jgi:nitroreductase
MKKLKIVYKRLRWAKLIFSLDVKAVKDVCLETWMHLKYAAPDDWLISQSLEGSALSTIALKDIHRIEKGLSLDNAKRPFGVDLAKRISIFMDHGRKTSSNHQLSVRAVQALDSLKKWNTEGDRSVGELTTLANPYSGTMDQAAWAEFFKSRKSIRNYSDVSPPPDSLEILKIIELAINTPSVCNRQSWRVWYLSEKSLVSKVLLLQNGNSGFRNLNAILIFGVDRRKFTRGSERNQHWVDGGLFAMSTIWALHANGLGSCFLNWSVSPKRTSELRALIGAEEYIEFITLCAVGRFEKDSLVAISPRQAPSDYITFFT